MNDKPPNTPTADSAPAKRRWPLGLYQKSAWLAIGLVVLVLIFIGYFGLRSKNTTSPAQAQPAIVSITSTGFSPAEIVVKTGSQVTWTNQDSAAHEVAADPYPKNNSIPGFNSKVLLQAGDSYSFSFSQPGTYHVHDQLHPLQLLGTLVVK